MLLLPSSDARPHFSASHLVPPLPQCRPCLICRAHFAQLHLLLPTGGSAATLVCHACGTLNLHGHCRFVGIQVTPTHVDKLAPLQGGFTPRQNPVLASAGSASSLTRAYSRSQVGTKAVRKAVQARLSRHLKDRATRTEMRSTGVRFCHQVSWKLFQCRLGLRPPRASLFRMYGDAQLVADQA